jgi:GNAT superfamily N-acetyltransferase
MPQTNVVPPTTLSAAGMTLRQADLDDAALEARVLTALHPDEPKDPAITRHWWATEDPEWTTERWIVSEGGRDIGLAYMQHAPWAKMPERFASVGAALYPEVRTPERLNALHDLMEARARSDGARVFVSGAREDDPARQAFLQARGYREKRRMRSWELDLAANRDALLAMLERSRARMREQGIRVLTFGEDPDPDKLRKIHEMNLEAERDVPTTVPHVPYPLEITEKWFASPGLRPDRIWLARVGDDIVGISMLSYPPSVGHVWTDWTGTARKIRGKGVARALKLETVAQAMSLGVTRVRTSNDGENAPILHVNEDMGYRRIPGWIQYHLPAQA